MLGQIGYQKSFHVSSPSRMYVVMCNKTNFDGYYFRRFTLPEVYVNDCAAACRYFLGEDISACVQACFPIEQYNDINELS
jgi:hypothetical protein